MEGLVLRWWSTWGLRLLRRSSRVPGSGCCGCCSWVVNGGGGDDNGGGKDDFKSESIS